MSGETKFVCQRREFRLVVPADGSNEIPRRLKSCQLLSVSLSLSFSFSLLPSSSSFCLIFLLLSRRRLLETLLVRISRDTFRKEITPCRWRGKEKPGKATRFIKQESCSPRRIFSCEFFLSLSLYTTRRERKRYSRDHCYFGKLKKAVPVVEKMIYKCKFILSTLYMSASNRN